MSIEALSLELLNIEYLAKIAKEYKLGSPICNPRIEKRFPLNLLFTGTHKNLSKEPHVHFEQPE